MRHLYGVGLAVLLAAGVFFGAAWGYTLVFDGTEASAAANSARLLPGGVALPAGGGSLFTNSHVMLGGGLMLVVGLAAGLLMVAPRVSPLAAGLPGLVLVGWTALYVSDVREAVRLIPFPSHGFGMGFQILLYDGLLGMAGLAMIVPLFIPSRWRRAPGAAVYAAPDPSMLGKPATVAAGTGDPDLGGTAGGWMTSPGGDGTMVPDQTQTLPQRSQVIPPDGA
jgi:hypothetical protein